MSGRNKIIKKNRKVFFGSCKEGRGKKKWQVFPRQTRQAAANIRRFLMIWATELGRKIETNMTAWKDNRMLPFDLIASFKSY